MNFKGFDEMVRKREEEEINKAIEADYDSGDDLKEYKEKWKANRLAKRAELEESMKSKKCKYENSIEKRRNHKNQEQLLFNARKSFICWINR
jgi:hypothetical protein